MMTGGVDGGEGVQETVVADLIDREGGSMMLCFPLVSSADPKRGVNDEVFLLLICFFRGDERECSKARFSALTVLLVCLMSLFLTI